MLPLAEESASVARVRREGGRVRVSLRTETLPQEVTETLRSERVEVSRHAVDRVIEAGEPVPEPRRDANGDWIIPVLEEVLVVERRLLLREEVRLTRHATEEQVREVVALRRQVAEVEHIPPGAGTP
ncbi:DUF2382 domain-containing protein [Roseococcus sp. DSY-14]|uniref:DUF2382 domain-containing protein n=1 Tax=Roseococcus sp. DSY-14 TaxID=3369650 RepID=UPI00387B4216